LRRSRTRFAFARAFDVEEIMLQKIAFALVAMFVFAVESIADNRRDSHGGKHPL